MALPNGCLCCHLRGDLEETLIGAAMRRRRGEIAGFDRVIVETSGLADPGPVAQTLFADQALGARLQARPDRHRGRRRRPGEPQVRRGDRPGADRRRGRRRAVQGQIARSDLAQLPKTKSVRSTRRRAAFRRRFGDVDPALLVASPKSGDGPRFLLAAAHASGIASFVLSFPRPVSRALLERFLSVLVDLRGADLLRVKGIVALDSGEHVAVQGVRHVFDRLRPVSHGSATGLVFIAQDMEKREVEALWQAMSSLKGIS